MDVEKKVHMSSEGLFRGVVYELESVSGDKWP